MNPLSSCTSIYILVYFSHIVLLYIIMKLSDIFCRNNFCAFIQYFTWHFIVLHSRGRGLISLMSEPRHLFCYYSKLYLFLVSSVMFISWHHVFFGHNLGTWPVMEGTSVNVTRQQ